MLIHGINHFNGQHGGLLRAGHDGVEQDETVLEEPGREQQRERYAHQAGLEGHYPAHSEDGDQYQGRTAQWIEQVADHAGMRLATAVARACGRSAQKGCKSMRPANLINKDELIHRAERWPVPMVVLVATCVAMTVAAVWA